MVRKRNTWLTVGLFAALVLGFVYSALPEPPQAQSASAHLLDRTIYEVGEVDHDLLDHSRATMANGSFSGLAHRELTTRIWYPMVEDRAVALGRHPLLIFNHGFSSAKQGGGYLARFMARQGYIVAATDFPLTQVGAPGGATARDAVNQPGDVSFLIDTLLRWDAQPGGAFHQRIDRDRIGTIGISVGGLTSAWLIYHPALRDQRIRLGVAVAAPLGALDPRWLKKAAAPFMVVASGRDALVDYARHAQRAAHRIAGATLITLDNASHAGFSGFSRYFRWLPNPDLLTCARVRSGLLRDPSLASLMAAMATVEEGRSAPQLMALCRGQLSPTINPLRQQWITMLSVYSFVQQQFAGSGTEMAAALRYLHVELARDFSGEVTVDAAPLSVASLLQRGQPADH